MRNRLKICLLFFITFISMISVGFAGWIITTGDTLKEINGGITSDTVVRPEFIKLEVTKQLVYSKDGFIGSDGNQMKVLVTVDLIECKETFGLTTVSVEVYTILEDGINDNVLLGAVIVDVGEKIIDLNTVTDDTLTYEVVFTVNFDDSLNDIYFNGGSPLLNKNVFIVEAKISIEE